MKDVEMPKRNRSCDAEIRANRIVLVDNSGNDRIVMQVNNGQPSISLLGLNGSVQARLAIVAAHDNSAELILASPDGKTIGRFDVIGDPTKEGAATLMFGGGYKRVVASTNLPGMLPSLNLTDEAGHSVAHLPTVNLTSAEAQPKPKAKKVFGSKAAKKR
jgi:hypothetical protein